MCVCQRSIEYTLLMIVCPLVFYIEDELGATCCFISLTQHESIMSGGYCTKYKQWQLKVTVIYSLQECVHFITSLPYMYIKLWIHQLGTNL